MDAPPPTHVNAGPAEPSLSDDDDDPVDALYADLLPVARDAVNNVRVSPEPRDTGTHGFRIGDTIQRVVLLCLSLSYSVSRTLRIRALGRDAASHDEAPGHGQNQEPHQAHGVLGSLRAMLFSSWINGLLIFVPLGVGIYLSKQSPILTFVFNAIAIVPLSSLLTDATEKMASDAGKTVGALLNITLGNLVELILLAALVNDHLLVVLASVLGSMIVNLLLILGSALVSNSLLYNEPMANSSEPHLLSSILFVSVFVLFMPTAFNYTFDNLLEGKKAILQMSRISAIMVLAIYVLYFLHELKNRSSAACTTRAADAWDVETRRDIAVSELWHQYQPLANHSAAGSSHPAPTRTIRFADEGERGEVASFPTTVHKPANFIEMGSVGGTGVPRPGEGGEDMFNNIRLQRSESTGSAPGGSQPHAPRSRRHSYMRSRSASSIGTGSEGRTSQDISSSTDRGRRPRLQAALAPLQALQRGNMDSGAVGVARERGESQASRRSVTDRLLSVIVLATTSGMMSVCAELLVSTIDDVTKAGHLSRSFIGLIILPVVGNIAEYVTVVTVATKGKLDLGIAVAVGSAVQIALCVTPLTVLAGWALHRELSLTFSIFELTTLGGAVLLVNVLILGEGGGTLRAGGLKGALLCICYAIIGLGAYFSP